jgi:hypothetical protein
MVNMLLCGAIVSLLFVPPLPRAYKAFTEVSMNSVGICIEAARE